MGLHDVAGMIRSFHYAAYFALSDHSHQDLASAREAPLWGRDERRLCTLGGHLGPIAQLG